MAATFFLLLCAQALFVQLALSQCAGYANFGAGLASNGWSSPISSGLGAGGCAGITAPAVADSAYGYNGLCYGNAAGSYGVGLGGGCAGITAPTVADSAYGYNGLGYGIAAGSYGVGLGGGCAGITAPAVADSAYGYNGLGYGNAAGSYGVGLGGGFAGITAPAVADSAYGYNGLGYGNAAGSYGVGLGGGCAGITAPAVADFAYGYNGEGYGNVAGGYGAGLGYGSGIEVIPTGGGHFHTTSSSATAPTGITITSENAFEGTLYLTGELPFLSVVALDGVFPTGGAGTVSHSCGNGLTVVQNIAPATAEIAPAGAAYGLGVGAYSPAASIAPAGLSIAAGGYNAAYAPAGGCGCGYQSGLY